MKKDMETIVYGLLSSCNKELKAGKDVTIIDTVTLEGLEVGTQYKLVGRQMLKEENAELLINGKRVESDYTFYC